MRYLTLLLLIYGCNQPEPKNEYLVNITGVDEMNFEDLSEERKEMVVKCYSFCRSFGFPGPNTIHSNGCFCKGSKQ